MRALGLLVILAALAVTACSGSDPESRQQPGPSQETVTQPEPSLAKHYTTRDLEESALQPSDTPRGLRYAKFQSGRRTPAQVGFVLERQVKELRDLGLRGIWDSAFATPQDDIRLVERLWLFSGVKGAQGWLEKSEQDSQNFGLTPVTAPRIGEASWAARGNLGAEVITHAFRIGNVVAVTSYTSQRRELSESAALAAAQQAAERLRG